MYEWLKEFMFSSELNIEYGMWLTSDVDLQAHFVQQSALPNGTTVFSKFAN